MNRLAVLSGLGNRFVRAARFRQRFVRKYTLRALYQIDTLNASTARH